MKRASRNALVVLVLGSLASLVTPSVADASPDGRGTFTVATWDAGVQTLDGVGIHVHVYYPSGMQGALPVLAVVHGASRLAANMAEMSNTFASRGFVVLAPDMPCNFTGCDHAANARQIRALLDWGVAQSAMPASMLAGKVDGTRRGAVGHSWGGLGSFLASKGDPDIDAVVVLDPNDDAAVGAGAAPMVTQPTLHVMAEKPGSCNGTNWKTTVYPLTPAPHMRVMVTGAAHCDVEDPGDAICPIACGSGNPALAPIFRRYAVAWMGCILQRDKAMASWLGGGTDFGADVAASRIMFNDFSGLAALPCASGASIDGGVPGADSGTMNDAGTLLQDADTSSPDSGTTNGATPGSSSGCGCVAAGTRMRGGAMMFAIGLVIALLRRSRRGAEDAEE